MFVRTKRCALLIASLAFPSLTSASAFENRAADATADTAMLDAPLMHYRALNVDLAGLRSQLAKAPDEFSGKSAAEIDLPTADGGTQHYFVWRTQVLAPALAARYPQIRSFVARAADRGEVEARIDDSPHGVSAMIRAPEGITMLQPVALGNGSRYIAFQRNDVGRSSEPFQCHADGATSASIVATAPSAPQTVTGATIRTYRLAVATTGEYTDFFGGTVPDGIAAIAQAINRINGIYLTEFAVQFQVVANNDLIVYTDPATDPYDDGNPGALIDEVQSDIDDKIGPANYDFGHLFSTGGGGLAAVGVACANGSKASGVTGIPAPVGDAYWVDYVAHEMGHQMGAGHSFNSNSGSCGGNRSASQAAEPGSGSTIMAYAGICSPSDLQPHSDAFFHAISLTPIQNRLNGGGSSCGTSVTNTNHAPVVDAVPAHTIPKQTPFQLSGTATDVDADDELTYEWDEMDHGAASPPETDNGNRALFRSFTPQPNGERVIPELPRILAHNLTVDIPSNGDISGETWATTTRTLHFRLTVRDNHVGGGATVSTDTTVSTTATAGPFLVTAPTATTQWPAATTQTVAWDVANTTAAPVSCAAVDILYSDDGGNTFATTLASNVPNSGTAQVTAPFAATTHARVEVICHDNIFFDISPSDFTVLSDVIFADGFGGD
jgi:hypothetical protein